MSSQEFTGEKPLSFPDLDHVTIKERFHFLRNKRNIIEQDLIETFELNEARARENLHFEQLLRKKRWVEKMESDMKSVADQLAEERYLTSLSSLDHFKLQDELKAANCNIENHTCPDA